MFHRFWDIYLSKFIGFMLKVDILTDRLRQDKWWVSPMLVLLGLLSFVVYSTWAAWQGEYFWWSGGCLLYTSDAADEEEV